MKKVRRVLIAFAIAISFSLLHSAPANASGGYFNIQNGYNGLCAEADSSGGDGKPVYAWYCNAGYLQSWSQRNIGYWNGYMWFELVDRQTGKCLDGSASKSWGAPVVEFNCYAGPTQLWTYLPIPGAANIAYSQIENQLAGLCLGGGTVALRQLYLVDCAATDSGSPSAWTLY